MEDFPSDLLTEPCFSSRNAAELKLAHFLMLQRPLQKRIDFRDWCYCSLPIPPESLRKPELF